MIARIVTFKYCKGFSINFKLSILQIYQFCQGIELLGTCTIVMLYDNKIIFVKKNIEILIIPKSDEVKLPANFYLPSKRFYINNYNYLIINLKKLTWNLFMYHLGLRKSIKTVYTKN